MLRLTFRPASVPHDWRGNAALWRRWAQGASGSVRWPGPLPAPLAGIVLDYLHWRGSGQLPALNREFAKLWRLIVTEAPFRPLTASILDCHHRGVPASTFGGAVLGGALRRHRGGPVRLSPRIDPPGPLGWHDGWNQEDALIVNSGSVGRGLYRPLRYAGLMDGPVLVATVQVGNTRLGRAPAPGGQNQEGALVFDGAALRRSLRRRDAARPVPDATVRAGVALVGRAPSWTGLLPTNPAMPRLKAENGDECRLDE